MYFFFGYGISYHFMYPHYIVLAAMIFPTFEYGYSYLEDDICVCVCVCVVENCLQVFPRSLIYELLPYNTSLLYTLVMYFNHQFLF